MINALGLLEVDGMVAAIDAADAMLKAANVRLLSHEVLDPGRLTLVVEGDLAACREPDAPVIVAESADELLALLTSVRQGMTAGEVAAHFGWPLEKARNALEQLFSAGTLRKRSSRYRLKPH